MCMPYIKTQAAAAGFAYRTQFSSVPEHLHAASKSFCLWPLQVLQQQGFTQLNGSGLGVLEGFLGYGDGSNSALDNKWVTPCPAGSRVDGYQVVTGPLLMQIRPRCSCYNCGATPFPPLFSGLGDNAPILLPLKRSSCSLGAEQPCALHVPAPGVQARGS